MSRVRIFFVLSISFLSLGCGSQHESLLTTFAHQVHINVLYWDNKNLGFGHIALKIDSFDPSIPSTYLSYAMGNDINIDLIKHEKEPVVVDLPQRRDEEINEFFSWYFKSHYYNPEDLDYGKDYNILTHNCAHAILHSLRALNFDLEIKGNPIALTPKRVFNAAKKL